MRSFMGLAGGGLKGAFNFHLKFPADIAAVGVCDSIPDERAGGVAVEALRVSDAGFNRVRDRTVAGNAGVIEVIEEEYHGDLVAPEIGAHAKEITLCGTRQQKE